MTWKIKTIYLFSSFQTSPLVMMDSSGAIMRSVFLPDGDAMDTRLDDNITN